MMDDHATLSAARVELTKALMVLLNPDIMTATDFRKSRKHATAAVARLDDMLGESRPCALPDDWGTALSNQIIRLHFVVCGIGGRLSCWFGRHNWGEWYCRRCGRVNR